MPEAIPTGPRGYVISLRPRGAHGALRTAARRAGYGLIALSPWAIGLRDDASTRAALQAALAAPRVVFTSPQAVRAAVALGLSPAPRKAITVGAATARALRRAGVEVVVHPGRADSEGLLALPVLQDVAGEPVGLVGAPGGRGLIEPSLRERGAQVWRADVYDRARCPLSKSARRKLLEASGPLVLMLSSAEALHEVLAQLDARECAVLRGGRVIAASRRLADIACALGFSDVMQAAGPAPVQLVAPLNHTAR